MKQITWSKELEPLLLIPLPEKTQSWLDNLTHRHFFLEALYTVAQLDPFVTRYSQVAYLRDRPCLTFMLYVRRPPNTYTHSVPVLIGVMFWRLLPTWTNNQNNSNERHYATRLVTRTDSRTEQLVWLTTNTSTLSHLDHSCSSSAVCEEQRGSCKGSCCSSDTSSASFASSLPHPTYLFLLLFSSSLCLS